MLTSQRLDDDTLHSLHYKDHFLMVVLLASQSTKQLVFVLVP